MFITGLRNLPPRWLTVPLQRAFAASSHVIESPYDRQAMAVGIFDWPRETPAQITTRAGTVDHDTVQSTMQRLLLAERVGDHAEIPVVDALSARHIVRYKAFSVIRHQMSNWDALVRGHTRAGDTRSYGGVAFWINLPDEAVLRFVVASSGARPWKDHQLSALIGDTVVALLIAQDYLPSPVIDSEPFILPTGFRTAP